MESLDEILKRLGSTSTGRYTDATSSAPDVAAADAPCGICGGMRWLSVDAEPGAEAFGTVSPCDCQEAIWGDRKNEILAGYSNLGPLARLSFDRIRLEGREAFVEPRSFRAAVEAAREFAERPSGWLVIEGPSGGGKTHLAAAIVNACIEAGKPAFFIPVPELLDHLRGTFEPASEISHDDLLTQVANAPILTLDDFGAHVTSPWAEAKLDQILTRRYHARTPTVVTLSIPEEALDDRMRTRLLDPQLSTVCRIAPAAPGSGWESAGLPRHMLEAMTFDSFRTRGRRLTADERDSLRKARSTCLSYANDPDGWLVLAGPTGTGKTHLAVAIAGARLTRGEPVIFSFVPDLLDHLRLSYGPASRISYDRLFEQVRKCQLLILDDYGAESATPWAEEKLYQIIVHRHYARLPTVITSRLLVDEPRGRRARADKTGRRTTFREAIASRLKDHRVVTVVPMVAPDYREGSRR